MKALSRTLHFNHSLRCDSLPHNALVVDVHSCFYNEPQSGFGATISATQASGPSLWQGMPHSTPRISGKAAGPLNRRCLHFAPAPANSSISAGRRKHCGAREQHGQSMCCAEARSVLSPLAALAAVHRAAPRCSCRHVLCIWQRACDIILLCAARLQRMRAGAAAACAMISSRAPGARP